ncbi:GCN5-related N-acetyltransferase [Candidatus Zixiibacteriota bacterium]|nr:GCN5-related N-acetyltransferase [candidate division Zixibacteria bacterium]
MIKIRQIREEDAENFLAMLKMLDNETTFMMYEPGERTTTIEQQQERIREILSKDYQATFVAEDDGWIVGYLAARGGELSRIRHRTYIVVGIIKEFRGRGVGKKLFDEMEKWARAKKMHRLELTVMVSNERGIRLYQKMGFEFEGVRKDSMLVEGEYIDEYNMFKLLD